MKPTISIPAIIASFLLGAVLALPGPVPVVEPNSEIAARQGVITVPGVCHTLNLVVLRSLILFAIEDVHFGHTALLLYD